jgi:hypothetical protein
MARIVVVGGGWAGCAAALAALKAGAVVLMLERTDTLLGAGLVGGIMRNNGRFTATEEAIAMGGGELFQVCDSVARHQNLDFPGHRHATLYDVCRIEPAVRRFLLEAGVTMRFETRATDAVRDGTRIVAVKGEGFRGSDTYEADVFVEATGTAGPQGNCTKYGNGCVMCILRCPTFGPRVSLAARCGVQEMIGGTQADSLGSMSGSCKLHKDSLSREIVDRLDRDGLAIIPIPGHLQRKDLSRKACQQYNLPDFAENIVLLDTGHAKLMASYFPLSKLRQIPGFENARYEDPYSGGIGNSMRYMAMSPRDNHLKVRGLENLFCGGEKAGPLVGHTEAIVTGTLAGNNAVRHALGLPLLTIPTSLTIGDAIDHIREQIETGEGLRNKYTFSGSVYFARMQALGLYTIDVAEIRQRVEKAGMLGAFDNRLTSPGRQAQKAVGFLNG